MSIELSLNRLLNPSKFIYTLSNPLLHPLVALLKTFKKEL